MRMLSLILGLLVAAAAWGQSPVYKHVDKDGKVTYSEKPPAKDEKPVAAKDAKAEADAVRKLNMDRERNVIKPLSTEVERKGGGAAAKVDARLALENQKRAMVEAARARLEKAKEDREAGKDPNEDEWQTIGAAKGKPARIPSEAYHARIKALDKAVEDAEANLAKALAAANRSGL